MSSKVIDIYNTLNFVSDYNSSSLTSASITIDTGGIFTIFNTTQSQSSSVGALVIQNGGLSINALTNATNVSNGGALTVAGGVAIGGNLIVGGGITYLNPNNSFENLTLSGTRESANVTTGTLVVVGGVSIRGTNDATSITSGGGLTMAGGLAVNKSLYVGGASNLQNIIGTNSTLSNIVVGNITTSSLLTTRGNITNVISTNITSSSINVTSELRAVGSNTIGSIFTSSDLIGMGRAPTTGIRLDINGTLRASATVGTLHNFIGNNQTDFMLFQNTNASGGSSMCFVNNSGTSQASFGFNNANSSIFQNSMYLNTATSVPINIAAGNRTGNPVIFNASDNSVSITTTTDAFDTSSGALKVSGGVGIVGDLFVGGEVNVNSPLNVSINNTRISANSTSGSMQLIGGLSININDTVNANATSYTRGGGITLNGGIAVSQDMYVGGVLDVRGGSNNMNPVRIQSIQISSNFNNGASTVIQSGNATRDSNSFTPIAFAGWNDQVNPKLTINASTIVTPNALSAVNNSNTIGSIFTTGGNVGIGTTNPSVNLDVVGTGRFSTSLSTGRLLSSNQTTTNGVFTNVSIGTLNADNLTTGNINFTGILSQNGSPYISSQWTGTTGTLLYYGSGGNVNVGIGTTNPQFTLDVNGAVNAQNFIGQTINLAGISNDIVGTFDASNNVTSPSVITSLIFPTANIRAFNLNVSIQLLADSGNNNLYANYTINGIQNTSGWSIDDSYIGDVTGISFSIDNNGQLYYTSSNINNWISCKFIYKATSYSISGNYVQPAPATSGNFVVTGNLTIQDTRDSNNSSVGSIVTGGGIGVAKSIHVGGNTTILGNMLLGSNITKTSYTRIGNNGSYALPPAASGTINGVNITALNRRTRASNRTQEMSVGTWISSSLPSSQNWRSVTWSPELGIFCAVASGPSTVAATSPDGIVWTSRTLPSSQAWWTITWSAELGIFCTIAQNSAVAATSPDGINWTQGTLPSSRTWRSVMWSPELSIFCAVASGPTTVAVTSPDGINWTQRTLPSSQSWWSIMWSAELGIFCAVASGSSVAATSPDGINWTQRVLSSSQNWRSVTWSPELGIFCVVAGGSSTVAATSPDGINWTERSLPSSQEWNSVTWSPELGIFCTVTEGPSTVAATSSDGIIWTQRSLSSSQNWFNITWSAELSIFCAVAVGTSVATISTMALPASMNTIKAPVSQLSINSAGNVGINTTAPGTTLDITGHTRVISTTGTFLSGNQLGAGLQIHHNTLHPLTGTITSRNVYGIRLGGGTAGTSWVMSQNINEGLSFMFSNSSGTYFPNILTINTSGNVGVGTTEPSFDLDVSGVSRITTSLTTGALFSTNQTTTNIVGTAATITNLNIPGTLTVVNITTTNLVDTNISAGVVLASTRLSATGTSNTIGSIFTTGGNVGIGSTSPSARLQVNGSLFAGDIADATDDICLAFDSANTGYRLGFVKKSGTGPTIAMSNTANLRFQVANSANIANVATNTYTTLMTLSTSGFLDVNGGANILTSLTTGALFSTNQTTTNIVGTAATITNLNIPGTLTVVNITTTNLVDTNISAGEVIATNISSGTLNLSTGLTTGNIQMNGSTMTFNTTGGTQPFINIDDTQVLRFGSNTGFKPHVLVVGNNFVTQPGRISIRYSNFTSFDYVDGSTVTERLRITTAGNVGIGSTAPSFRLQLSTDSAAKPSTNTWTISSDMRLKNNIELADLNICYNTVKSIPLKRYTWREDVYSIEEVGDRSKLGWIAQDVEGIFPKAVGQKEMFGYTDCRTLNSDQIIASLYGAVQKLINKVEVENEDLRGRITELENYKTEINNLKIENETLKSRIEQIFNHLGL